jgi:hypothetical protein
MTNSINKIARAGGTLYLIIIVTGIFGEMFVRNKLIVSGDAAATANNIMASQFLWRVGIAGDLLMHICDVPLLLVFYILLKPVNKNLMLLALLFTLIQTAVLVATKLNLFMPLFLSGNAEYLKIFDPHQLQALSYISIRLDGYGFAIGLIFFGFACPIIGYLIFKSGYLPRFIGIAMQVAGICYITNSFVLILDPALSNVLFPAILLPPFIAETSFCLWLIIKGVNFTKWEEKTNAARVSKSAQ